MVHFWCCATTTLCNVAFFLSRSFTIFKMVIVYSNCTYTQCISWYRIYIAWFKIVSWLLCFTSLTIPIVNSRCPLPIGNELSMLWYRLYSSWTIYVLYAGAFLSYSLCRSIYCPLPSLVDLSIHNSPNSSHRLYWHQSPVLSTASFLNFWIITKDHNTTVCLLG